MFLEGLETSLLFWESQRKREFLILWTPNPLRQPPDTSNSTPAKQKPPLSHLASPPAFPVFVNSAQITQAFWNLRVIMGSSLFLTP